MRKKPIGGMISDVPKEVQDAILNDKFNYVDRVWNARTAVDLPIPPPVDLHETTSPEEAWLRMPHVVVNGMTNAGKSSLINHVLRWSYAAKASSVPGKTDSIDFYVINAKFVLVDLPGYPDPDQVAHLGVAKNWERDWEDLVWSYLERCVQRQYDLRLLVHLQTSKSRASRLCRKFVQTCKKHDLPVLLALTKDDQLTQPLLQRNDTARRLKDELRWAGPHLHYTTNHKLPKNRKVRRQLARFIRSTVSAANTEESVELLRNAWGAKPMEVVGPQADVEEKVGTLERVAGLDDIDEATMEWTPALKAAAEAAKVAEKTLYKQVNKLVQECSEEDPTYWKYTPFNNLKMILRVDPRDDSQYCQDTLEPGDIFKVVQEKRGASGVLWLRLANNVGWAYDRSKKGVMCKRKKVPPPASYFDV